MKRPTLQVGILTTVQHLSPRSNTEFMGIGSAPLPTESSTSALFSSDREIYYNSYHHSASTTGPSSPLATNSNKFEIHQALNFRGPSSLPSSFQWGILVTNKAPTRTSTAVLGRYRKRSTLSPNNRVSIVRRKLIWKTTSLELEGKLWTEWVLHSMHWKLCRRRNWR
jgi:hypothetical protein